MTKKKFGEDNVYDPKSGQIFVFGSNLAGIHGAGAALYAHKKLDAKWGRGEGLASKLTYALPTKDENIETLPLDRVQHYVERFMKYAALYWDDTYFVTRVGCGLAGFTDEQIAPMFKGAPSNCILPPGWRELNGEED